MKEIKRYTVAGDKIGLLEHANGEVVLFSDYERLQARVKELESERDIAIKNGKQAFEQLKHEEKLRKQLESQSHINEIKAQGIADYLEKDLLQYTNMYDCNHAVSVEHIEYSIKKLRTKHD